MGKESVERRREMRKRIKKTIGVSDFKKLIDKGGYFIDKSLFIKEVWEDSEILLIPRPRRFGKTLNLSMIRYFFEASEEDRSYLFKGLKIWEEKEMREEQGKYPVIQITFKDAGKDDYKKAYEKIQQIIARLYREKKYVIEILDRSEKELYEKIIDREAKETEYEYSIEFLTSILYRYHGEKVIVLIDEYDVPIQESYIHGYYEEMISFMRGLLESGLKDNAYLHKGVITGCLRIARESIFTGLNNLAVYSLLREEYREYFGFTEEEVEKILEDIGERGRLGEVEEWYNGYRFGGEVIYNPWSILNYAVSSDLIPRPYWINTSSNELVKTMILDYGTGLDGDMEELLRGRSIEKRIEENIVFRDLEKRENYVWSILLFSGYLRANRCYLKTDNRNYCELSIPNNEVRIIFEDIFSAWIEEEVSTNKQIRALIRGILRGEERTVESILSEIMKRSLSYWDPQRPEPEKVYHAFILGLLVTMQSEYIVKSNIESGYGRVDVMIIPKSRGGIGVVMELKVLDEYYEKSVEKSIEEGKKQIEENRYEELLIERGVKEIVKYVAVFDGKRVWVRKV